MKTSISPDALARYVSRQLGSFFPDGELVGEQTIRGGLDETFRRLDCCFSRLASPRYQQHGRASFDHLYSDQYLMFLWFLANSLWKQGAPRGVLDKLYLLNKTLHAFDCAFDTQMPDIFVVIHGVGTVLGKAKYSDFLVVYQGCTVGQAHGRYPVFGKGVGLGAGASVIGGCTLGDNVSVGAGCTLINKDVPQGSSVYRDDDGKLVVRSTQVQSIAAEYFLGL